MQPTEDPAGLDERRAAMGLYPMPLYACMMSVVYGKPVDLSPLGRTEPQTSRP